VEALTPDEVIKVLNTIDHNSVLGFRDLTLYTMLIHSMLCLFPKKETGFPPELLRII